MREEMMVNIGEEEISELSSAVYKKYGYDFSDYSPASFKRRINRVMMTYHISSFIKLKTKIIEDEFFFNTFLEEVTVNVTEMFRDPSFYKALRQQVMPSLSTYPLIRIWHAGCSSGEEVFSLAIILKEAGLLERSLLYATDINQLVLEKANSAKFPIENMKEYSQNYIESGGLGNFSDYYVQKLDMAVFNEELRNRMVFSPHNLVIDQSFNEFNLILCRNVLIYFKRELQNKVVKLFFDSLVPLGFLALGNKESIELNTGYCFEPIDKVQRIWKKKI